MGRQQTDTAAQLSVAIQERQQMAWCRTALAQDQRLCLVTFQIVRTCVCEEKIQPSEHLLRTASDERLSPCSRIDQTLAI